VIKGSDARRWETEDVMLESVNTQRRIGRFAWVMAWVGLIVGQLHALARFATEDGKADLELPLTAGWAKRAADLLQPLLGWANPDVVYVTYGKIWFPIFLAITLCAFVVYRRRQPARVEKWAWRFAITAYTLASIGVFLDYWTQWTGKYNGDGIEGELFTLAWFRNPAQPPGIHADFDRARRHPAGEEVPADSASGPAGAGHPAGLRDPEGHLDGQRRLAGDVRLRDPRRPDRPR
jgi:hypothetical protein